LIGELMKTKIHVFLALALISLTLIPAANLVSHGTQAVQKNQNWWSVSNLYNTDILMPLLGRAFYAAGISIDPKQVIIGKDGWFYLGDAYAKSITVKRVGVTPESILTNQLVTDATKSWTSWYKDNGVSAYRIIIGPDKDTLYPEFLPGWAKHSPSSRTEYLTSNAKIDTYVNPTEALRQAKSEGHSPLYYRTDTHWNFVGAGIAFQELAKNLSITHPELKWPSKDISQPTEILARTGGDLARFQRITDSVPDEEVILDFIYKNPITIEQYEYPSGKLLASGRNSALEASQRPLLVKSEKALNKKKVLWLRDSFGNALAPYMAATFSETLQLHYAFTSHREIAELVEEYQPDYVFVMGVEREILSEFFQKPAPSFSISKKITSFKRIAQGLQIGANDLAGREQNTYTVTGPDPFIVYRLDSPVEPAQARRIVFNVRCQYSSQRVPIQLFWRSQGTQFSEADSVRFSTNDGLTALTFAPDSSWAKGAAITELRLDLDAPGACPEVSIAAPETGSSSLPL